MTEALLPLENVVLAPHLGSATRDTRVAMGMLCVDALRAVLLEGRTPAERGRVALRAVSGYGCQSMWGDLERVLVRRPLPEDAGHVERYGWRGVPDHAAAAKEHEALCMLLEAAGAEVIVSEHDAGNPDAIYAYDPVLVGDEGAALLRPGKEGRQGEPEAIAVGLEAAGVPVVSRIAAPATAEGGDTVWLDRETLLVGHGYRTGAAGIDGSARCVPGRRGGRARPPALERCRRGDAPDVVHLSARPRPRARVPAHRAGAAAGAARRARDRDRRGAGRRVRVDGPQRARARPAAGSRSRRATTRRGGAWSAAGVDVVTYAGDHISRLGDGGPTCLTRPILRR